MTKPRKLREQEEQQELPPEPKPKRYVPPSCSMCTADRPTGKEYTVVYSIHREGGYVARYCRCGWCGNTFKTMEKM